MFQTNALLHFQVKLTNTKYYCSASWSMHHCHSCKYQSRCCCRNWKTSVASSSLSGFLSGCHLRQRNLKLLLRDARSSFRVLFNCSKISSFKALYSSGLSVEGTFTLVGGCCGGQAGFALGLGGEPIFAPSG